jgi:hypothetical protein
MMVDIHHDKVFGLHIVILLEKEKMLHLLMMFKVELEKYDLEDITHKMVYLIQEKVHLSF